MESAALAEKESAHSYAVADVSSADSGELEPAIKKIFSDHDLEYSDGTRIGRRLFAAALPVLARGGWIVFREADGQERKYSLA